LSATSCVLSSSSSYVDYVVVIDDVLVDFLEGEKKRREVRMASTRAAKS